MTLAEGDLKAGFVYRTEYQLPKPTKSCKSGVRPPTHTTHTHTSHTHTHTTVPAPQAHQELQVGGARPSSLLLSSLELSDTQSL